MQRGSPKDQSRTQNDNFICCLLLEWKSISRIMGKTHNYGVQGYGVEHILI